jgi:hypothetical protein
MLEGLLIFPDLHAKSPPDSMKSGKNTVFSNQSKRLTHSATEKSTCLLGILPSGSKNLQEIRQFLHGQNFTNAGGHEGDGPWLLPLDFVVAEEDFAIGVQLQPKSVSVHSFSDQARVHAAVRGAKV